MSQSPLFPFRDLRFLQQAHGNVTSHPAFLSFGFVRPPSRILMARTEFQIVIQASPWAENPPPFLFESEGCFWGFHNRSFFRKFRPITVVSQLSRIRCGFPETKDWSGQSVNTRLSSGCNMFFFVVPGPGGAVHTNRKFRLFGSLPKVRPSYPNMGGSFARITRACKKTLDKAVRGGENKRRLPDME